jgi:Ras-related protein Rab-1A
MVELAGVVKVLIVGAEQTGKTQLCNRFARDTFDSNYINTIGVDFSIKTIEVEDKAYKLQIWDTAGHERFRTITAAYYRGVNAVVMLFDITSQASFESLLTWIEDKVRYSREEVPVFVIGNKTDQEEQRQVSTEAAMEYCRSINAYYMEVSAKTGHNISTLFNVVVAKVKDSI